MSLEACLSPTLSYPRCIFQTGARRCSEGMEKSKSLSFRNLPVTFKLWHFTTQWLRVLWRVYLLAEMETLSSPIFFLHWFEVDQSVFKTSWRWTLNLETPWGAAFRAAESGFKTKMLRARRKAEKEEVGKCFFNMALLQLQGSRWR